MRTRLKLTFAAFLLVICSLEKGFPQQQEKEFWFAGESMYFLMHVPAGYNASEESYPLIVFLHGMGERGRDYSLLKKHGPPKNVEGRPEFPFLVLSPQLSMDYTSWDPEALSELLNQTMREYRVDSQRIFLTGLSMGGYGTWAWAIMEPLRFAAIAPICGGGNPTKARNLGSLPTWVFHGAQDTVVPIYESQKMVNALDHADGDVRFTVYPNLGHVSWNEAYDSGILYTWFSTIRRELR